MALHHAPRPRRRLGQGIAVRRLWLPGLLLLRKEGLEGHLRQAGRAAGALRGQASCGGECLWLQRLQRRRRPRPRRQPPARSSASRAAGRPWVHLAGGQHGKEVCLCIVGHLEGRALDGDALQGGAAGRARQERDLKEKAASTPRGGVSAVLEMSLGAVQGSDTASSAPHLARPGRVHAGLGGQLRDLDAAARARCSTWRERAGREKARHENTEASVNVQCKPMGAQGFYQNQNCSLSNPWALTGGDDVAEGAVHVVERREPGGAGAQRQVVRVRQQRAARGDEPVRVAA